jgi:hypothetical protein
VRRVEKIQHLEVVECLPQGVRARFSERFRAGKGSGGIGPSRDHQREEQGICARERSSKHRDPGGYRWPPTFSDWLKTVFWQFWQFTIFSRF